MDLVLVPVLQAIVGILSFYQFIIFINIILSWLITFGVIDIYKYNILGNIFMFTRVVTEPIYNYIRRFIPPFGMLDFSPVIVILGIYILSEILNKLIYKLSVVY